MAESAATSHGRGYFRSLLSYSPEADLLVIELSVLLASAFLVLRLVHGAIRRRVPAGGLSTLMDSFHILTPLLIIYIIGLMHSVAFHHELFPVWAYVLVYMHGGVDTSTARRLGDIDQVRNYNLQRFPLLFWCGWLVQPFYRDLNLLVPLATFFFMAGFNSWETAQALLLASKSKGLPSILWPVVEYMRQGADAPSETEDANPVDMRGYRYYLIQSEEGTITTTEDVWRSQTCRLLLPNSAVDFDSPAYARSEGLKDMALSLAWFWLLLRRFAGFALYETGSQRTRDFVYTGLLSTDPAQVEKLFRILEVELGLLYDFFYTKYFVLSFRPSKSSLWRLACVPFFLWFAFFTLYKHAPGNGYLSYKYHGHSLEIGVTRVVLGVIALLEICQMILLFLSNWKIVTLLCRYVRYPNSHSFSISNETLIIHIWAIKDRLSRSKFIPFFLKPWQRKLGQYSFIECYGKHPMLRKLSWLLEDFVDIPRVGQSGDFNVALAIEIKCEIVSSLLRSSLTLSPGKATLERYELLSELPYMWDYETDAKLILIWHIATSVCEFKSTPAVRKGDKHFTVATQISRYCAYLVTFSPELLPDHHQTSERAFDQAVREALVLFDGLDLRQRYLKMMAITEEFVDADGIDKIVAKGAVLGRELIEHVLEDSSKGWKVLAEFWAELLLYMTPSNHEDAHGMHLAQGGEFITHLWALLTHAGIVARDSFQTPVV